MALAGYYTLTELRYGIGAGSGSLVRWGLDAVVGGPVFGIAGHLWRHHEAMARAIGLGLLAAVFIAEGVYQAAVVDHQTAGTAFAVIGLLLPLLLGRSRAGSGRGVCGDAARPRPRGRWLRGPALARRGGGRHLLSASSGVTVSSPAERTVGDDDPCDAAPCPARPADPRRRR